MNESDVFLYTEPAGDCLIWTRGHTTHGYGKVNIGGYRYDLAHRVAYRQAHGAIPDGMVVMHSCDNPPCVKPDHLRLGSYRDNAMDMVQKGRRRSGPPKRGADWIPPRFTTDQADAIRSEYRAGGITQGALAAREGVATVTIARLVRGASYPPGTTLIRDGEGRYCRHPDNVKRVRAAR